MLVSDGSHIVSKRHFTNVSAIHIGKARECNEVGW
jgi:hypothetical protein